MTRSIYLTLALSACLTGAALRAAERGPNVILIMADDLGYECLGANGGTSYQTPVLDKLAATGARFTHCFVQPLCTPTRVQLMTGMYNIRNYTVFGILDPAATTFAHVFKQAGYSTCVAGKWQLGRDASLPAKFGFDEHCLWQLTRRPSRYKNPGLEINGKEVDFTSGEYGPDIVNDYVLDYVRRKKDSPFFVYYPMMLTHGPYDPTPDSANYGDGGKTRKKTKDDSGVNANFRDMVQYMDKLLGKLVARLDELRLRDNTLILFLGDNGTGRGTESMMGDKLVVGGKGTMTHRGMHVPLIASWPGTISSGKVCSDLVDSTDFFPTILAAAGLEVPSGLKIDGQSFLPQLKGEKGQPRNWYYSWYAPQGSFVGEFAANHQYKLYRDGRFFDLAHDPEEQSPRPLSSLGGDAATASKTLQSALDQFADARPEELRPADKPRRKRNAKGAKTAE